MSTALTVPTNPAPAQAGMTTRHEFGASSVSRQAEMASAAVAAQAQAMVQARYVMALQRPRDWDEVRVRLLKEVERPGFAESAWYRKPIGEGVEGLSVRFAEAAARTMGNLLIDAPVVYDDEERRTIRVIVCDLESNLTYTKDITVTKTVERRFLKKGQEAISARQNSQGQTTYLVRATEDDLLAKEAAQVSKAFRTGVLRVLPGDLQDSAKARIKAILQGEAAKDPDALRRKVADAFADLGVSPAELKKYLGHELATCSPAELTDLRGLHAALKSGEATWAEVLEARLGTPAEDAKPDPLAEKLKAQQAQASTSPSAEEQEAIRQRELSEALVGKVAQREVGADDDDERPTAAATTGQATLAGSESQASHVDRPTTGRRGVR